jgi:hypothetical protein
MIMRSLLQSLLPRYCQGTLPSPLQWLVRQALVRDAQLALAYDGLRQAERLAAGHDGLLVSQQQMLWQRLQTSVPSTRPPVTFNRWMLPASLATAALAIAVFSPQTPSSSLGTLSARAALIEQQPLGVRARCLQAGVVTAEAVAGARQAHGALSCDHSGLLALSTTNLAAEVRYAFVVGIDANHHWQYVPPFAADTPARAIAAGAVDDVLETLMPMGMMNTAAVTLFVLLSEQPFAGDQVERQLQRASHAALPLAQLDRLPIDVPIQARLLIQRTQQP